MNGKATKAAFVVFLLSMLVYAQATTTASATLSAVICNLYKVFKDLLPVIGFVLFVLAGVAYAAGNFFGAEVRAKSTGWAMNMIVGAIIAFVLNILGPLILNSFGYTGTYCP